MHETTSQHYLGHAGEIVEIDSQTEGGALTFFLDGVQQNTTSFTFPLLGAPGTRTLGAVYIASEKKRAAVRVRQVTNRANSQDITIMVIPSGANHASTTWGFETSDSGLIHFLTDGDGGSPAAAPRKRTGRKARKNS